MGEQIEREQSDRGGRRAVIIGGSMGGLLAARVVSQHYDEVFIVERDEIGDDLEHRKGAPQGRHVHTIFGNGAKVIESLFPGFFDELVEAGAVNLDFSRDIAWYHHGVWKLRTDTDFESFWQSRPLLEGHLRRRVRRDTDVQFMEGCVVTRLLSSSDGAKITGVELSRGEEVEPFESDLVIDASGRGSRLPKWLEQLGRERPEELSVGVDLCYASRVFELPAGSTRDWGVMAMFGTPPRYKRTAYIFPIEGDRWLVSLVGYFGDHAPDDEDGYLQFARDMELSHVHDVLEDAKPLTPITRFRYPAGRWRRYDKLRGFPDGLLVLGDAVCSFNPVYGQGMSACALQVQLLARMLDRSPPRGGLAPGFAARFLRRAAKIIGRPWLLATNSDFMYPQTSGKRPLGTRFLHWYVSQVFELCAWNKPVLLRFHRVMHFMDPPTALFHPSVAVRVVKWGLGLRGGRRLSDYRDRPMLG